jgi:lipopolysaccharide transport system ATP-binding protein
MSVIIKAEGLGKKYILSHQRKQSYYALRDVMAETAKRWGNKILHPVSRRGPDPTHEEFWALKDVSFEINQGDRVGIIGRNGAGKSTLLKILSRITEPTTGRVKIQGRVASLLEVGTGFHPELTGRENVYLNGAILGMSKSEIKRKFDEIIDFAEVEKFLDTPVKRYSSGMYVRLAFAVAAHLEPEILVVDEVLAVGDAQFQKKCLGKMESVSTIEGRTVLFVSHDMSAIKALCNQVLLLANGQVVSQGGAEQQIADYLAINYRRKDSIATSKLQLSSNLTLSKLEFSPNPVITGNKVKFTIVFKTRRQVNIQAITIVFYSLLGMRVAVIDLRKADGSYCVEPSHSLTINGETSLPFVEGDYKISLYVSSAEVHKEFPDILDLTLLGKPSNKSFAPYSPSVCGVVELESNFTYSSI